MTSPLAAASGELAELTPLVRRAASLDPATLVRLRLGESSASALVRLPFGVLAGRAVRAHPVAVDAHPVAVDAGPVAVDAGPVAVEHGPGAVLDVAVRSDELLAWLDGTSEPPEARDTEWRGGLPPDAGWRRIESVPDGVVRDLVRTGALAVREAAEREGVPGAQPRAAVADAMLDAAVITASSEGVTVEISLRLLSALTRMGFLPRDSHIAIDVAGRWLRIAAAFGSVYAERPGLGLGVIGRD